jgi:hypothetical protein
MLWPNVGTTTSIKSLMDEVMSGGRLSSVVTTGGGVVAQRGHHNINPKLDGVVRGLDFAAHMTG